MIFKNARLGSRLGKAHGLLLSKQYEKSYQLLSSILSAEPADYLLQTLYSDLGIVEYHRGNFQKSIHYLEFCIKDYNKNPKLWESHVQKELLKQVLWYHEESEKQI